jgi:hypothetical protein
MLLPGSLWSKDEDQSANIGLNRFKLILSHTYGLIIVAGDIATCEDHVSPFRLSQRLLEIPTTVTSQSDNSTIPGLPQLWRYGEFL